MNSIKLGTQHSIHMIVNMLHLRYSHINMGLAKITKCWLKKGSCIIFKAKSSHNFSFKPVLNTLIEIVTLDSWFRQYLHHYDNTI